MSETLDHLIVGTGLTDATIARAFFFARRLLAW